MMGQNKFFIKIIVLIFISAALSKQGFTQSVILRPSLGNRYFSSKTDFKKPNYFDPSYNGNFKFAESAATIAVELLYPKCSYELVFTSQQEASGFYTNSNAFQGSELILQNGGISQFQIIHNRFLKINNKKWGDFSPFIGAGIGIGINRPPLFYIADTFYTVFRTYNPNSPNEYIELNVRSRSMAAISFSAVFKAGLAFKINNIERVRLQAVYNFGINKIVETNIIYYHTNAKYYGSAFSRGSQFSVLLSVPIYLKRKK